LGSTTATASPALTPRRRSPSADERLDRGKRAEVVRGELVVRDANPEAILQERHELGHAQRVDDAAREQVVIRRDRRQAAAQRDLLDDEGFQLR
jgi:hypothetical protein